MLSSRRWPRPGRHPRKHSAAAVECRRADRLHVLEHCCGKNAVHSPVRRRQRMPPQVQHRGDPQSVQALVAAAQRASGGQHGNCGNGTVRVANKRVDDGGRQQTDAVGLWAHAHGGAEGRDDCR